MSLIKIIREIVPVVGTEIYIDCVSIDLSVQGGEKNSGSMSQFTFLNIANILSCRYIPFDPSVLIVSPSDFNPKQNSDHLSFFLIGYFHLYMGCIHINTHTLTIQLYHHLYFT